MLAKAGLSGIKKSGDIIVKKIKNSFTFRIFFNLCVRARRAFFKIIPHFVIWIKQNPLEAGFAA